MDPRLARVIYTLSVAAKLKKNNPEISKDFISKNPSYFPNKKDQEIVVQKGRESSVKTEGYSNPMKNLEAKRDKINKIIRTKNVEINNINDVKPFVELDYEKKIQERQEEIKMTKEDYQKTQQFKIPIVNTQENIKYYQGQQKPQNQMPNYSQGIPQGIPGIPQGIPGIPGIPQGIPQVPQGIPGIPRNQRQINR